MNKEQSQILADAKRRSKTSYAEVKDVEKTAGGREMPPGLEGCVGISTSTSLGKYQSGDDSGKPFVTFRAYCVEPEEYMGIYIGETMPILESKYASEEENQKRITKRIKMLSDKLEEVTQMYDDFFEMLNEAMQLIDTEYPCFGFVTGRKTRKDGSSIIFIQGPAPLDYAIPDFFKLPEATGYKPSQAGKSGAKKQVVTGQNKTSRPVKKKAAPPKHSWEVGMNVDVEAGFFGDGEVWSGEIQGIDADSEELTIHFPKDGDTAVVPFNKCSISSESTHEGNGDDSVPFEVGDVVRSKNDFFENGEDYEGKVLSLENGEADVEFEDGVYTVPLEYLRLPE